MKSILFIIACAIGCLSVMAQETGTFKDPRDGKVYKTVKIGGQWIMSENLAYRPDKGNFWTYNNEQGKLDQFGYLYDWETAQTLAPKGWHVPTKEEWTTLLALLGKDKKEILMAIMPGKGTGFNALPGGYRHKDGDFLQLDIASGYWSATAFDDQRAYGFYCNTQAGEASVLSGGKTSGFNVRLMKD